LPTAAQESVAVVNGASLEPSFPVSPGCWASAFGDVASVGVLDTSASALPLPTMLGQVTCQGGGPDFFSADDGTRSLPAAIPTDERLNRRNFSDERPTAAC